MNLITLVFLVFGAIVGSLSGYFFKSAQIKETERQNREKLEKEVKRAKEEADKIVVSARDEAMKAEEEAKKLEREKRRKLQEMEQRLVKKEEVLDSKSEKAEKIKEELEKQMESLKGKREETEKVIKQQEEKLQEIASLDKEQAKKLLLDKVEEESKDELIAYAKKLEDEVKSEADVKAKQILVDAIQRYASETAVESTTTIVDLPSDDLKGRIIGREGRNINAFETVTGVDVIVDDTPGSIVISGFDPIRRYVAKVTLERLVEDGRIHPARIEETVAQVREEVNVLIKELGEKAAFEVGVAGLPPNLVKILGRLKFRIAYGQNVLKHSMEVAFLAAELAGMVGANVDICKKAGLLHDIGKAVDHEVQGKHAIIGRDILKKFGMSDELVHCVEANEGDVEAKSLEAKIVQVANLISVSRPGADRENLENYVKRLSEIERIATSFEGVERAFAVQAGRQLRAFVVPKVVDDLKAIKLANQIARKIESDLQYTGKIKVDVVRELRVEALAE
ncbi:ribonuclease Y [Patescibacteria group bacterium]|nr:ribonuclease Y [Patescibacteria group bacterium]